MIDRQKVEAILARRFPGSTLAQVAAAANAIVGLPDEWEEISHDHEPDGSHDRSPCDRFCWLREAEEGGEFRLFRRKEW